MPNPEKISSPILPLLLLMSLLAITSCIPSRTISEEQDRIPADSSSSLDNPFTLPVQVHPPPAIQNLRLHPAGSPEAAPVVRMDENVPLRLSFDYLNGGSRQFRAVISHRDRSWEESPLPPGFYLDGFHETYFSGGKSSLASRPSYTRYSFEFPGQEWDIRFKASGNYLLSVYSYRSGELLFTLPFFVSENEGSLKTRLETLFARQNTLEPGIQPFGNYRYPPFVEFPGLDLAVYFAPDQFWGRSREADRVSRASPGTVDFHLGRELAFDSEYSFLLLELPEISADGNRIIEVRRDTVPPLAILRRDQLDFDAPSSFTLAFAGPRTTTMENREAEYARVRFRLDAAGEIQSPAELYVTGNFNRWNIDERYRLRYNEESKLWTGTALVSEGTYRYSYVQVSNGKIRDLRAGRSFSFGQPDIYTFVYYRDPSRNFDRLLKVDRTESD